jgi:MFS family permease
MHIKWRIYFVTLVSYAVVHSLRTMWSAIKSELTTAPFGYQLSFLGTIDMVVLFVIAVFMNILGSKVEHWGARRCLLITLAALLVFNTLVGIFLNLKITAQWLYVVFFGLGVGISSSTAWPSCLYMVSLYFDKRNGITLSAWNGTSQLGDFISLISFFAIVASNEWQPQSCFFLGSFYILVMLIVVAVFIPTSFPDQKQPEGGPPRLEAGPHENVAHL